MCDFWLGNELIHQITASGEYSLRLDMTTTNGDVYFATYSSFTVNGESDKYILELGTLIDGNAGDVLSLARGRDFSTYDRDNDDHNTKNCAMDSGGWWYSDCFKCSLNGFLLAFKCAINDAYPKLPLSHSEMKMKRQ
ncbi:ficolin-1-like [Anneissia japonica]|uniref:ficolin-1-like n=1 Tax=Anneissia japonica TaxID=1529436 RepID=UPI0014256C03|nr:ficolin-1-like [Anneissia japonica]